MNRLSLLILSIPLLIAVSVLIYGFFYPTPLTWDELRANIVVDLAVGFIFSTFLVFVLLRIIEIARKKKVSEVFKKRCRRRATLFLLDLRYALFYVAPETSEMRYSFRMFPKGLSRKDENELLNNLKKLEKKLKKTMVFPNWSEYRYCLMYDQKEILSLLSLFPYAVDENIQSKLFELEELIEQAKATDIKSWRDGFTEMEIAQKRPFVKRKFNSKKELVTFIKVNERLIKLLTTLSRV